MVPPAMPATNRMMNQAARLGKALNASSSAAESTMAISASRLAPTRRTMFGMNGPATMMPSGAMAALRPMIDALIPRFSSSSDRIGSVNPIATSTALIVAIAATRLCHRGRAVPSLPSIMGKA